MTDQYKKGRRFEWAVRDDLEAAGYIVVRSAGSKTNVDIVAWKQGEMLFVQCKDMKRGLSVADWNGLIDVAHPLMDCHAILAVKTDGVARPSYLRLVRRRSPRELALRSVHYHRWTADVVGEASDA